MEFENVLSGIDKNALKIFNIILHNSPITISALADNIEMPRTTLNRYINELIDRKLIIQEGYDISSGGRPPSLFSPCKHGIYMIGIDISRLNIRLAICNLYLTPMWTFDIPIDKDSSPKEVIPCVFAELSSGIERIIDDRKRIIGIGIGSVGPIDTEKGVLLMPSVFNNDEWNNINLKQMFEEEFNIPTFVANGVSTAAMGEYSVNSHRGIANIAYINIGAGIRCSLVYNGNLLYRDGDFEYAFAHTVVQIGGKKCYCGKYGCVESYGTIPAILEDFSHELKMGRQSSLSKDMDNIKINDICKAAQENDILSAYVIENAAIYMGIAVANMINIFDPEMIVIGGKMPEISSIYYDKLVEIAKNNMYNTKKNRIFSMPTLRYNSIAIGGAALALSNYL